MENSIMPDSMSDAYASCYAASANYEEAVKKVLEKLISDGLYPVEIFFIKISYNRISSGGGGKMFQKI